MASTTTTQEYVWTADEELIPRGPIGQRSTYTTPKGRIINLDLEGLPMQLGPKPKVIEVKAEETKVQEVVTPVHVEPAAERLQPVNPVQPVQQKSLEELTFPSPAAQQTKSLEDLTVPKPKQTKTLEELTVPSQQVHTQEAAPATPVVPAIPHQEEEIKYEDFPILKKEPWLLGGSSPAAQEAGFHQLEKLVKEKDSKGVYKQFERDGYTLNYIDKIYIESTLLQDTARQQAANAAAQEKLQAQAAAAAATPAPIIEPIFVEAPVIPTPIIKGQAAAGSIAGLTVGASGGSILEMLPGLTTLIIVATFIMTLYQIYKYVKQVLNTKVSDYEGFQNPSFVDTTRFINRSQNPPTPKSRSANRDDGFGQAAAGETFDFDASEVGCVASTVDFEEYTGGEDFASCNAGVFTNMEESKKSNGEQDGEANVAISNLDKLMEGSQVSQRGEYW